MMLFPLKSSVITACNHEEVSSFVFYNGKLLLIMHFMYGRFY